MELELEELEAEAAEDATAVPQPDADSTNVQPFIRRKPVRGPLPAHLPRERVVLPGPTACPCCGGVLAKLGETITETLEVIPRQWKVVQTVREKFTCRACETITQPPAPFHPIPRGRAGANLLAMVLDAKFANHLPLNRQSEAYAREGIDLDVSTLADWVGAGTATLAPLFTLLQAHVMAGERLHGDDTTVPVLARGKTITGRLWTYVRDDRPFGGPAPPAAIFYYSRDRGGEHPQRHLAGYRGILQADAYAGFNDLYSEARTPDPVIQALCRVGGDVAAPTPHRPGRADFPHPVLHGRASLGTAYWRVIRAGGKGCRLSRSRRRSHRKFPCRPLRDSHFFQTRST